MNELANHLETIHSALKALGLLRAEVTNFCTRMLNLEIPNWEALGIEEGASWKDDVQGKVTDGEQSNETSEKGEERVKAEEERKSDELRQITNQLEIRFRELETACTLLFPHLSQINLANTQLIGQDSFYEKSHTYQEMVICYRWLNNSMEYSLLGSQAIGGRYTKGKAFIRQRQRMNNAPRFGSSLRYPALPIIDAFINQLSRITDMRMEVIRPFGVFTVLKVTLGRTLCAALVFRGYVLEWALVKGIDESFDKPTNGNMHKFNDSKRPFFSGGHEMDNRGVLHSENPNLDIWTPSRYQIFRVITDHANTAILHFYSVFQMDSAIKGYMHWLRSYMNLFSDKCTKCNTRLLNCMPPTWRDFRTNPHQPFHFECRP